MKNNGNRNQKQYGAAKRGAKREGAPKQRGGRAQEEVQVELQKERDRTQETYAAENAVAAEARENSARNNALQFISDYNIIDARLRAVYRGKGNLQFSDLVRRCAEFHPVVRRYEEELITYAKLRNAIVHNSTTERIIAQPCDEVTDQLSHIARLLSMPPKLSELKEKGVVGLQHDASLGDALIRIAQSGYSNLPVYRGDRMVGMLNNRRLVREVGNALARGEDMDEFLARSCRSVLHDEDMLNYYKVLGRDDTVHEALEAFEDNKKLLAVVVTDTGRAGDKIVNIITAADLPRLLKLLDE